MNSFDENSVSVSSSGPFASEAVWATSWPRANSAPANGSKATQKTMKKLTAALLSDNNDGSSSGAVQELTTQLANTKLGSPSKGSAPPVAPTGAEWISLPVNSGYPQDPSRRWAKAVDDGSPIKNGRRRMEDGTPPSIEEDLSLQNLYKTELCRSFRDTGECRYGFKCQFAHGDHELRLIMRHPKYKTEPCKTYAQQGSCPYGDRCRFIHPEEATTSPQRGASPAARGSWSNSSSFASFNYPLPPTQQQQQPPIEAPVPVKQPSSLFARQPDDELLADRPRLAVFQTLFSDN